MPRVLHNSASFTEGENIEKAGVAWGRGWEGKCIKAFKLRTEVTFLLAVLLKIQVKQSYIAEKFQVRKLLHTLVRK